MSGSDTHEIRVRARAKNNGLTAILVGLCLITISGIWFAVMPEYISLPGFFLVSAAIVAILIGWFKLREPSFSIVLTPENVVYNHRLGSWQLSWKNILSVNQPRVLRGLDHDYLQMIGFKIGDYKGFIQSISPRLAMHILLEQRPLLGHTNDKDCTSGMCNGANALLEDTQFKLQNGELLTGVQAMLANRMQQLRKGLGYDVFLSANELDRDPMQFVELIKECKRSQLVKTVTTS